MSQGLVFSDTTNKAGLIQDCELLLGFNDADISGNTTLLKRFTVLLNLARRKIEMKLLQAANPAWKWDDPNYTTDFPRGAQSLIANQHDYGLPTATGTYSAANAGTTLNVDKIAILDTAGYEQVLTPTDLSEAELNTFYYTAGTPQVYKLENNSVKVWPAPATGYVTLTNGLIVYVKRIGKDFASTGDDTQTPGFAVPFHRLVSLQASMDYAGPRKGLAEKVPYILSQYRELLDLLENHYANRTEGPTRLIRRRSRSYF